MRHPGAAEGSATLHSLSLHDRKEKGRAMTQCQVLYEVCYSTTECGWNPMGVMYETRKEAERELLEKKPYYPTAFLVRVVMTRCEEKMPARHLQAI